LLPLLFALELFGIVNDPGGLAVPGANVRATSVATQISRSTLTDTEGVYHLAGIANGEYVIEISKEHFTNLKRSGVMLTNDSRLDFTLALGETSQTIEVRADAPLIRDTRGTVSFAVDQRKIISLPLDGRNFIPLLALSPGVSLPPGSFLPRINGSRPRTSEYVYDGISALQPEPGQVAYYPIVDAIAEFRLETNSYSAEYGRSNGGVILVNQKSGTNQLHGSLFDFFRHEELNARNLFATTGAKPQFRRNQYGFVLGGPIKRDRTFFFMDWQGTRLATSAVKISTVPSLSQRTASDRLAANLVSRYPAPTIAAAANNYRRTALERDAQDQGGFRLDHYISDRQRIFARYTLLYDLSRPATAFLDETTRATTRASNLATDHTWILSPSKVNQFRFGHTQRSFRREMSQLPFIGDIAPVIEIAGFQTIGAPASANTAFRTSVTQFIDTYSWIAGRHSVKAGADVRIERLDALAPAALTGLFQFNSLSSFLLGNVATFSMDIQQETLRPRAKIAEFFLQDDWRATRKLSLNMGVRYTLNFPSTVESDRGAVFDLDTQKLRFLGKGGYPRTARDLELGNFGPRFGFAYSVRPSLVVRGGYGLTWIEQAGITTPFTAPMFPFIRTLTQRSPDNVTPAFQLVHGPSVKITPVDENSGLGQGVFAVQRDQKSGYSQQWNLSVQKAWASDWSAEIGYLGSKLTNLGVPDVNLNQGIHPAYPQFKYVTLYRNNVGHSTYHSLQARLEKRYSAGLTFTAAYTWSRLIDDAGAVFDSAILTGPVINYQAADSFNRRLEKDVSTGNIPNMFSASVLYMFRGWEFASIIRAQAGSPVPVTQSPNLNAFAGYGIQRPNRIVDPRLPADQRSTGRWFNTSAFQLAPQLTIGTSSRNPVIGPGYRSIDVMAGRIFHLTERLQTELRAEVFNVLNTPPLSNPNGTFGTAAFGTISSAGDPRVFELAMKLRF
jgi:hypothetical protein